MGATHVRIIYQSPKILFLKLTNQDQKQIEISESSVVNEWFPVWCPGWN